MSSEARERLNGRIDPWHLDNEKCQSVRLAGVT